MTKNNTGRLRLRETHFGFLVQRGLAARANRGQAMVEFALLSGLVAIVLLVGIQIAIIGNALLSVSQLAYMGARYASVNPTMSSGQVQSYMQSVASPTISGGSSSDLVITVPTPCVPNSLGSPVTVQVQYSLTSKLFLPNPFLGIINFPTSLSSTQTAFCEGS